MRPNLPQHPSLFKSSQSLLPTGKTVKPGIRASLLVHGGIRIQYLYYRQMLPLRHFEVHRVMAWRNLDRTGAECKVNSAISNNRNHPPNNWKDNLFAHHSLEVLVTGVHRHCSIAEVGLRSGSRHGDKAVTFSYRIEQRNKNGGLLF